jgi:opacity protein-like surface antigen
MKKLFAAIVMMTLLLSAGVQAQPKGTLQLGVGTAHVLGGPTGLGSYDVLTVHVAGMYFPSNWSCLVLDYSYGFPHKYEMTYDGETDYVEVDAAYLDVMAGFTAHFSQKSFLYFCLGLSTAWGNFEFSESTETYDLDTSSGFGLGFGVQTTFKDRWAGFFNLRQRFIDSDVKGEDQTIAVTTGGLELDVGIAITFGSM